MDRKNHLAKPKYIYLTAVLIGVIFIGIIAYSFFHADRINAKYTPLFDLSARIKFECALSHLWLEEMFKGDSEITTAQVFLHIDNADEYVKLIIEGGQFHGDMIYPIDSTDDEYIKERLDKLKIGLSEYRRILELRAALVKSLDLPKSESGNDIEFDRIFSILMNESDSVETGIRKAMDHELSQFQTAQIILIPLSLVLIMVLIFLYRRFDRQRQEDYEAIEKAYRSLAESREWFSTTLHSIGDGVIATDNKGIISFINPTAQMLTGFDREAARGKHIAKVYRIIDEFNRETIPSPIDRILYKENIVGLANHTILLSRDGREIPIDDRGAPIKDDNDKIIGVVLVFQDVTEKRKTTRRIEHLNAVLKAIRNVNQLITKENDVDKLIRGACLGLVKSRGFKNASIALINPDREMTHFVRANIKDGLIDEALCDKDKLPHCGRDALVSEEAIIITDPSKFCVNCPLYRDKAGKNGIMAVRIAHESRVFGYMSLSMPMDLVVEAEEKELIKEVAGDIAFALYSNELDKMRQMAEDLARDKAEEFKNIVESSPLGIFIFNLSDQEDLILSGYNKAAEDILRKDCAALMNEPVEAAFPPFNESNMIENIIHIARTGGKYLNDSVEYEHDGIKSILSARVFQVSQGQIAIKFEDVTERKLIEEQVRQQAELLNQVRDAVAATDLNGVITAWNKGAERLYGYSEKEAIGKNISMLYHEEDLDVLQNKVIGPLMEHGEHEIALRLKRKTGEEFYGQLNLSLVENSDGEVVGMIGNCSDVTEKIMLEKERERLLSVVDETSDFISTSTTNRKILYSNRGLRRVLGWPLEGDVGDKSIADAHPDWAYRVIEEEGLPYAIEHGVWSGVTAVLDKDGNEIPTSQVIISHKSSDGQLEYLSTIIRDISDIKKTEEALRNSENQLRSIFKAAPIGIGIVKGRILGWTNNEIHRMTGYTADELEGQSARILYPTQEEYERVGKEKHADVAKFGVGSIITKFKHKDGRIIDVLLSSAPVIPGDLDGDLTFTALDITEQTKAERALKESESTLQTIFRTVPAGIGMIKNRVIKWINEGVHDMIGYTQDELRGQLSRILYPTEEEFLRVGEEIYDEMHRTGLGTIESQWVRKTGEVIDVMIRVSPKDPNDPETDIIFTALDITQAKRFQKTLLATVEGTIIQTGENYFKSLVSNLAESLESRYAYIGDYDESSNSIITRSFCEGNQFADNFTYNLNGTPCENVIYHKSCVYTEGVQNEFPDDELLTRLNIHSYMGTPLIDSEGKPRGILVLMDDKPIDELFGQQALALLELFASRAAVEMERLDFEGNLQAEKDRAQRYLDVAGTILVTIDTDQNISMINRKGCEILGYESEAELIGKNWFDVCLPEYRRDKVKADFQRIINGEIKPFEYYENAIITRAGETRLIAWYNTFIKNDEGKVISTLSSGIDITQRKKAEKQLRESEERWRSLTQNSPDYILTLNKDLEIVFANRPAPGLTMNEIIGKPLYEFDDEEFREEVRAKLNEVLETQQPIKYETVFRITDGDQVNYESYVTPRLDNGDVVGLTVSARDITERIKTESALRESEEQYRNIFGSVADCLFIINIEGVIITANDAAVNTYGYNLEELIGMNMRELVNDSHHEKLGNFINVVSEGGQYLGESIDIKKDGTTFYSEIRGSRMVIKGMNLILAVIRDITERKEAEEEINRIQSLLSASIEQTPAGILIADAPDVRLRIANAAAMRIHGDENVNLQDLPEAATQEYWEVYYPDGRRYDDDDMPLNRAIKEGVISQDVELIIRRTDGTDRTVVANAAPVRNSSGEIVAGVVVFQDITEKKEAERELAASEERFRMLVEQAPMSIELYDADGTLVQNNDAWADLWHVENRKEPIGKFNVLKDKQLAQEGVTELIKQVYDGEYLDIPEIVFNPSISGFPGRERILHSRIYPLKGADGEVKSIVVMHEDISDKREAERNLAEERERLSVTLRSIGDAVIATDIEGHITIFNDVAARLTGWSSDEAIGRQFTEVFHIIDEDTRNTCENPVARVLETSEIVGMSNHTILVSRDGIERAIADSAAPIKDSEGNVLGVVLVFRDVTETKRLQEFAVRAQRLETAGRIASQVAHDFNNLLGPLVAFPDLARDELPEGHKVLNYIESMEKSAMKIADINQQLLTLGRRGHYGQTIININDIIIEVLEQLEMTPSNVEIVRELDNNLMNITGGGAQILRVINNLVNNAFDAMPDGGKLVIKTENVYVEEGSGIHEIIPRGEYVKCTVTDSGVGIPNEVVNKIFDPFFTTKTTDKRRGSGLGLSVVHAVVEDHNGYIDYESDPDIGTKFFLYFPITREDIPEPEKIEHIVGGNEKILAVDDDVIQLDVSKKLLEKLGYQVEIAESGEKAVEMIDSGYQPDLVILDMIMPPGIDGAETYRCILESKPDQKAIIVSGYAQTDRVKTALSLGATKFIRKPLTIKSLAGAIRETIDG